MSVKEAAVYAGVSEALVRGWVASGQLVHFRLGAKGRRGKIAIAAEDLDALLASFKVVAAHTAEPERQPAPAPRKPVFKHLRLS